MDFANLNFQISDYIPIQDLGFPVLILRKSFSKTDLINMSFLFCFRLLLLFTGEDFGFVIFFENLNIKTLGVKADQFLLQFKNNIKIWN